MANSTGKNRAKQLHAARLRKIRPFVDFNYDLRKPLSNSAKRKIKLYADEVDALTARPYQVVRPRRKDHLAQAQEFAQHERKLPGLKVAFIASNGQDKVHLSYNKSGVKAKNSNVEITHIRLSLQGLLNDPEAYVSKRISGHPAKSFTVQAGRYEIPASFSRDRIAQGVARYVAKYDNEDKNNYFGNWLHGVFAYQFHEQDTLQQYLAAKQKHIRKAKRERNRIKRKARRDREKAND